MSFKSGLVMFLVVFCAVFGALWFERTTAPRDPSPMRAPADATPFDFTYAADRVMPSVVSIDTAIKQETLFGDAQNLNVGSGSGVVIEEDGYIVTNAHVVRDPRDRTTVRPAEIVTVKTSDEKGYSARVVGIDEVSDLAVIKIENASLSPATLGDSDGIKVGDWVMAVGNQLGFDNSVSVGVVSSKNRWLEILDDTILVGAIQTDAAINKGNSGGALCNSDGEVIGINSTIATYNNVTAGVGFAVPSNHVKRVVSELIKKGYVEYAVLGVQPASAKFSLTVPQDRQSLAQISGTTEPPNYGIVVMEITPGLPAEKLGIKPFDVILEIAGRRLNSNIDYIRAVMEKQPGDKVELKYWSKGKIKTIEATLAASPRKATSRAGG